MPIENVVLGEGVIIRHPELVNLYGCTIGDGAEVGPFVEVQQGVVIGKNCRIQSHAFLCTGVTLEDDVFIGHGVMFTNDKTPWAGNWNWNMDQVRVGAGASIGSGAIVVANGIMSIGPRALVGAGAVVTRDVPGGTVVAGVPARQRGGAYFPGRP